MAVRVGNPTRVRLVRNVVRVGLSLHTSFRGQVSQLSLVHSGRMEISRCVRGRGSRDKAHSDISGSRTKHFLLHRRARTRIPPYRERVDRGMGICTTAMSASGTSGHPTALHGCRTAPCQSYEGGTAVADRITVRAHSLRRRQPLECRRGDSAATTQGIPTAALRRKSISPKVFCPVRI
jgi:hypothetical protein